MTILASTWNRYPLRLTAVACALWVMAPLVEAATVDPPLESTGTGGAFLTYDTDFTTVSIFRRSGDSVELVFGTSVNPDALPDDIIGMQILDVGGPSITLIETITNSGAYPWHEWVEEPFNVVNPLNPPDPSAGLAPSWASYASVDFGSNSAVPGTFEIVPLLGVIPGLVFRFDTPLLPGESFRLQKALTYGGPLDDPDAGVQILSFGAALPVPPAVWLLGSALVGLVALTRQRAVTT